MSEITQNYINKKYKDKMNISFNENYEIFLYQLFKKCQEILAEDELLNAYKKFIHNLTEEVFISLRQEYTELFYLEGSSFIPNTKLTVEALDNFYESMKDRKLIAFKNEYEKFFKERLNLEQFKTFLSSSEKCHYCGITIETIRLLMSQKLIKTKRIFNGRGKSLEIDRKNSYGWYEPTNIVPCCYWCNNAKTDEFTEEEFKTIAKGIKDVWNRRILKYKDMNLSDKLQTIL